MPDSQSLIYYVGSSHDHTVVHHGDDINYLRSPYWAVLWSLELAGQTFVGLQNGSAVTPALPWTGVNEFWEGDWITPSLPIFSDGCALNSSSVPNCTQVCASPDLLFKSWQSLSSCLTLATLAVGTSLFPNVSAPHLDATNIMAAQVAVPSITVFDGTGVLNATYMCAKASCVDNSLGNCDANKVFGTRAPGSGRELFNILYDKVDRICPGLGLYSPNVTVSSDIAGPGVRFSYYMQVAIAVYGLIVSRLFTISSAIVWLKFWLPCWKKDPPAGVKSFIEHMEKSRVAEATTNLLVEFQEAQGFFVIAIQIALLHATQRGSSYLDAQTIMDYISDTSVANIVAQLILVPIVFTELNLRRIPRHSLCASLCTTFISAVAIVLGAIVAFRAPKSFDKQQRKSFSSPVPQCGNQPSLRVSCYETPSSVSFTSPTIFLVALFGMLLLEKLIIVGGSRWYHKVRASWSESRKRVTERTTRIVTLILAILYALSEIVLVYIIAIFLDVIYDAPSGEWQVGQLIAALVWAPPLFKYAYQIAFGVPEASESRMPQKYVVILRPDQSSSPKNVDHRLCKTW
ncbi:hypothetical protein GGR56DRAFT_618001 [Xylariaceae sp. FL0804]|nr:hypothetical protein GGR56DRAFT_618001 [Xylariaceae sp. FL0804]